MASCKIRAKMHLVRLRGVARAFSHFTRLLSCKRNLYLTGPRKKKALIVGINYTSRAGQDGRLCMSIDDAVEAKKTLIAVFGFKEEDIILLVDEDGGSNQPTHERMLRELQDFVKSDDSYVDYVFIYVGHADQSDAKTEKAMQEEEDGKSEYIMPLDSWSPFGVAPIFQKVIYDRDLRKYLVDRLGRGSKLLAIFNTCHSATLLNLRHHKCHRGGKFTSLVRRLVRQGFCDPLQVSIMRKANASDHIVPHVAHAVFPWRLRSTVKTGDLCTGLCHNESSGTRYPRVVCISGCKDSERTPESNEELSMLGSLLQLFKENAQPTFREVMDNTRANVKQTRFKCVKKTEHASLKGDKSLNNKRAFMATLSHLHRHAFAKLKPWNPEMAAEHTINMEQNLIVCLP